MPTVDESINCQLWRTTTLPADLRALLPVWRVQCFPNSGNAAIVWRESDYDLWVFAESEPVSTLKIMVQALRVGDTPVGDTPVNVGGIAGVMTPPQHRGHGYASAAMRHAADFLRGELAVSFGLLGCHDHRVSFYERLGWQRLTAEFTFDQPGGLTGQRFPWTDIPMILPLDKKISWPAGDIIDFNGLPW